MPLISPLTADTISWATGRTSKQYKNTSLADGKMVYKLSTNIQILCDYHKVFRHSSKDSVSLFLSPF